MQKLLCKKFKNKKAFNQYNKLELFPTSSLLIYQANATMVEVTFESLNKFLQFDGDIPVFKL